VIRLRKSRGKEALFRERDCKCERYEQVQELSDDIELLHGKTSLEGSPKALKLRSACAHWVAVIFAYIVVGVALVFDRY
jgi:hypothetical protein